MIATLRGTCMGQSNGTLLLEVGGVGYAVQVSSSTIASAAVGQEVFLHTAFIVREDAHLLFGFETADDLLVFDLLRSVSGVGPKSALAILSALSISEIAAAVASENDVVFRQVSGIGPKTAKLIAVSLVGKLVASNLESVDQSAIDKSPLAEGSSRAQSEAASAVVEALLGLGYPERTASPVVTEIATQLQTVNRNELLRAALARLGSSRATVVGDER